ncbi:hypothetical protein ACP6PM_05520 [Dapis sp. BLCC M229]
MVEDGTFFYTELNGFDIKSCPSKAMVKPSIIGPAASYSFSQYGILPIKSLRKP